VGKPGVIAIQEWWGLDATHLDNAQTIAAKGYRVLVPDLYRGKLGIEAEEAHHLMQNLDFKAAVEDIRGAAQLLKAEGSAKVGVTGFCMGGALSCAAAVLVPEVDCAAPFYGVCSPALADMSKARVPVQGHFGAEDAMAGFSDPSAAHKLEADLKTAGVPHEVFIYPGVGHAFMNSTEEGKARRLKLGQGGHDQAQVDLAWGRLFGFFQKHLQ
jgi:carboxymethylenebutenolidase